MQYLDIINMEDADTINFINDFVQCISNTDNGMKFIHV